MGDLGIDDVVYEADVYPDVQGLCHPQSLQPNER